MSKQCDCLYYQSKFENLIDSLCPSVYLEDIYTANLEVASSYSPPAISAEETKLSQDYQLYLEKKSEKAELCEYFGNKENPYDIKALAFVNKPKAQTHVQTPQLSTLLSSQGQNFCQTIWPDLSIRSIFLKNTRINETYEPQAHENITMMTEPTDVDASINFLRNSTVGTFAEFISAPVTAKDILGEPLPDLSFMLSATIK